MRAFTLLCLIATLLASTNAHMWLRTPLARGGLNNIGGTTSATAPACHDAFGSGTKPTTYQVGDKVTFQFRVNQHGPGPFSLTLFDATTNKAITTLASNLKNSVTAGPDSFDGVNVPLTIPANTCSKCYVMLLGMAQADGSSPWSNCADVIILAAGTLQIPTVSSITPTNGTNVGGTKITVTGTYFGNTTRAVTCYFDGVPSAGTWVSSTTVTCTSPARNTPSSAALEVSVDGGKTISTSGTAYTYVGTTILPKITSINPPKAGPNTLITITGSNFFSSDMQCKFTVVGSPTTVVTIATGSSSTQATCLSPPNINGNVQFTIEVNVDNSAYSQSGVTFTGSTGSSAASVLSPLSWLGGFAVFFIYFASLL